MKPRQALLPFLAAIALAVTSCDTGDGGEPSPGGVFDRGAMLTNYSDAIVLPAYQALQGAVQGLETAVSAFVMTPSTSTLQEARDRLKDARLAWQDANLFQFGPAEAVTLRASLNTYPVDEALVDANIASGDYVLGAAANQDAAGFPTIGYLLHGVAETDQDVVEAYTSAADAESRSTYLQDNVEFVKAAVDATTAEWSGGYRDTYLSPERGGIDVGSSLGMLVNAYVLHYERFLRDGKIGIPAGVRSAGVPRPTSTEAYHGGYSAELAAANLRAAKRFFLGTGLNGAEGLGLYENLEALDALALAEEIAEEFDEAAAALEVLSDPLAEQIENDNAAVLVAFEETQDLVALLKADMTSVLGITITFQDTDGD